MTTATLTTASVLFGPVLTHRQERIVRALAGGYQVKQIAYDMQVHENAVHRTITRVAARLPGNGRPLTKVLLWAHHLLGGRGVESHT